MNGSHDIDAIVIRRLGAADVEILSRVAGDVFDDPIDAGAPAEFLRDPRHHIVVAIDDDHVRPAVSACMVSMARDWLTAVGVK